MSNLQPVESSAGESRRSALTPVVGTIALLIVVVGAILAVRARPVAVALNSNAPGSPIFPTDMVIPARARAFVWHSAPGDPRYALELAVSDSVIYADTLRDTSTTLPPSFVLGNGDYVWSVRLLWSDSTAAPMSRWFSVRTP